MFNFLGRMFRKNTKTTEIKKMRPSRTVEGKTKGGGLAEDNLPSTPQDYIKKPKVKPPESFRLDTFFTKSGGIISQSNKPNVKPSGPPKSIPIEKERRNVECQKILGTYLAINERRHIPESIKDIFAEDLIEMFLAVTDPNVEIHQRMLAMLKGVQEDLDQSGHKIVVLQKKIQDLESVLSNMRTRREGT